MGYIPFANNYNKLVTMFNARQYYVNNTPYQVSSDKYTNDMAILHKELNFLNGRLMMQRILIVYGLIVGFVLFAEEEAKDWGDKFDVKFNVKAFGSLDDSSG